MNLDDTSARPVAVGIADKQPTLLDYARREAGRRGCGITLVHAYNVPPSALGSVWGVDIPEGYRLGGREVLDEALRHLERVGATCPVESELVRGYAPTVLERATRSAGVMIIGPDDAKPWYIKMFEGRVARHLAEHADCPVVVVPDTWEEPAVEGPVVVMVDGVSTAHGPLTFAFETASARASELRVLHVTSSDNGGRDEQWQTVRRVVDAWFERHPGVRGGSKVVRGDVRDVAVRAADGAGMLILGRPIERHAPNLLMDSLAQEIIAEADCPVAVVPGGYRG